MELSTWPPSAQFEPGDELDGVIARVEQMQQRDMTTGDPVFWDAAKLQPKMMIAIAMRAPGHKDADDDGEVTLYVSGGKYSAVKAVTKRLDEGARLWIKCIGYSDRAPQVKGHNRAKRYEARYTPPRSSATLDEPAPRPAKAAARRLAGVEDVPPF
jgi:hypothetical protein